jgi:hypothetical protein
MVDYPTYFILISGGRTKEMNVSIFNLCTVWMTLRVLRNLRALSSDSRY